MEKIEQEEHERGGVAAVGGQLDHAERGDAVGAHAAQFAVEISVLSAKRRHGHRDRRIFMRPVEPGAREQPHRAAVEARMHAVAIVFDFMQPTGPVRRRVDELGELRPYPFRQRGRGDAPACYRPRHAGSGERCRRMRLLDCCLSVGDREARADGQCGELIDRVAPGAPVRKLLFIEALGHPRLPFSGDRLDHPAGIELAAIAAHRAAEAAADVERRLDDGVAGEARRDRLEIRDFPGRAAAGHSVSSSGQVRGSDPQLYMGRNGPAGMCIAPANRASSALIDSGRPRPLFRQIENPGGGRPEFSGGRAGGKIRSSSNYRTASPDDRPG
jgi:hypothetical protein